MKNIYLLPTDKPSRLHLWTDENGTRLALCELEYSHTRNTQNLYITSEEEIKEGYVFNTFNNTVYKIVPDNSSREILSNPNNLPLCAINKEHYFKIILTDNQNLIKDGVQSVDDEFLEWVIKNPTCENIETIKMCRTCGSEGGHGDDYCQRSKECNRAWAGDNYKIIIPKEEPKQEVTINQFPSESVELFNQNNKSLGLINELQLLDVQCQIAEKRLEGYYVKMGNLRCEIDNCGELKDWDGVTFHREYMLLTKLKRIQQKHGKNKIY